MNACANGHGNVAIYVLRRVFILQECLLKLANGLECGCYTFRHMQQNFFTDHKQKYTSFAVVAIFIIFITYVVHKSEALGRPLNDDNFLTNGRRCPPSRVRAKLPVNHPCYQTEEEARNAAQTRTLTPPELNQVVMPVPAPESQPEQEISIATSSSATSTEEVSTSVEATTTVETAIETQSEETTEVSE